MIFKDRQQAGEKLAQKLSKLRGMQAIVVGLARGGVVVASRVAKELSLQLDVLIVRKISSPVQPELGIGALAPDQVSYIDWKMAQRVGADEYYIKSQIRELNEQIRQKLHFYRKGKKPFEVREKTVIIVDDGVATGATLEVAIKWLRKKKARHIVAAIPVAPQEVVAKIKPEVNELVVLEMPIEFEAVGQFYKEFPQIEDGEVVALLHESKGYKETKI